MSIGLTTPLPFPSSYSECLRQVRFGHNKDHNPLQQINLAMLFGEQSGLSFYYRKIAGNIPDVKTIREMVRGLDVLDTGKVKLVMDWVVYDTNVLKECAPE